MKNYYKILGVDPKADHASLRRAWLLKAHELHPDHNPDDPASEELFREALEAWRVLSDPFLKSRYDEDGGDRKVMASVPDEKIIHLFFAGINMDTVRQYDEMELSFTYTGQGRRFRLPSLDAFFRTGAPYLRGRMIQHQGILIRETTFRYVLCPMITGELIIDKAEITIEGVHYFTSPLTLLVVPNHCFFTHDNPADGKPLKVALHYAFEGEKEKAPLSERKKNHHTLVPRSRTAYLFHSVAVIMKVVFMIWGGFMLSYYLGIPFIAGALTGACLGGMNVWMMYRLVGVKSKYSQAHKYPTIKGYLDSGYRAGESTGLPLVRGNPFHQLGRLLF